MERMSSIPSRFLPGLFDLLFKIIEKVGVEEITDTDIESIAELLDGGNSRFLGNAVDDIAGFVDGDAPFVT